MNDGSMDTIVVAKRIKGALKARGLSFVSVKRNTGTASRWIDIAVAPSSYKGDSNVPCDLHDKLCDALGFDEMSYHRSDHKRCQQPDGLPWHNPISVMDSYEAYREFIDRAEGRAPAKIAVPYWH